MVIGLLWSRWASAQSRAWLKLLHAKNGKSEIVSQGFFLAENGPKDPVAELKATEAAFHAEYNRPADQNPKCRFPARFQLLKSEENLSDAVCPALLAWKRRVGARSATVVHAAQYSANPGSLFGHIFLRFDTGAGGHGEFNLDTLAYGVGYFAKMPPDVGIYDYVVKGIGGGFRGEFLFSTYARSLTEYNQMEDRDLWEYQLKLSPQELDQLLNHLWELINSAQFDYYFLLHNCGWQLLALIEAAVPRWELTDDFSLYLIPSDALNVLDNAGAVARIHYRPSIGSKLRFATQRLSGQQVSELKELVGGQLAPEAVKDSAVLDSALDLLDYQYHQAKGRVSAAYPERKLEMLAARAHLPPDVVEAELTSTPPTDGHRAAKLALNYVYANELSGAGLEWRAALYRLTEGPGYPAGSTLEFLDLKAVYQPSINRVYIDQVNILNVENLRPYDFIDHAFAWRLRTGLYRPLTTGEEVPPLSLYVKPGGGLATPLLLRTAQFYVLATLPAEAENPQIGNGNIGVGAVTGVVIAAANSVAFMRLEFGVERFLLAPEVTRDTFSAEVNWPWARNWLVSSSFESQPVGAKFAGGVSWFY